MFSVYYFFTRVMQCEYAIVITLYVLKSAFAPEACTVDMYSQLDNFHPEFNGTTDDALTLNTEYNTVPTDSRNISLQSLLCFFRDKGRTSFESIDITFCGIQEVLSHQFNGFDNLDTIDLSCNNISKLEEYAFCNLSVSEIILQDNALTTLASNSFYNLSHLVELRLSRNRLVNIDETALVMLPKLFDMYLEDNQLTDLPYQPLKKTRIEYIYLDESLSIDNIHFEQMVHRKYSAELQLIKANTSDTEEPFADFNLSIEIPNVEESTDVFALLLGSPSYARNNKIKNIKDDIADLSQLVKLDIRGNNVTEVTTKLTSLHHLNDLLISDNSITTLPIALKDLFSNRLAFIDISGNPWNCGCNMKWLVSIIQSKRSGLTVKMPPKCYSPVNVLMGNLNLTSVACESVSFSISPLPNLSIPLIPTTVPPSLNLAIPLAPTTAFLIVACVIAASIWLHRNRLRKKLKNLQMISNDQYFGDTRAWQEETGIDINTDREAPKFENKNFGDSLPLKHNLTGRLRLGRLLGRGEFGEVYEGVSTDSDGTWKKVAVKKLKDSASPTQRTVLETELNQLLEIGKHPNIIDLIGYGLIDDVLFIVMELAECGDLHAYLKSLEALHQREIDGMDTSEHKSYLLSKHPQLFVFMWSVSKGMEYLARLKIIHRDLAARNILLTNGPVAKLSDFGLSRDLYESGYYYISSKGRLPYKWMSPETLTNGKYTMKSDVWSFGVLLWEVVTFGSMPFPGIPPDMLLNIHNTGYVMPQPTLYPDYFYELMVKCWRYESTDRPSFDTLVENIDKFIQNRFDNQYIDVDAEENDQLLSKELQDTDNS